MVDGSFHAVINDPDVLSVSVAHDETWLSSGNAFLSDHARRSWQKSMADFQYGTTY